MAFSIHYFYIYHKNKQQQRKQCCTVHALQVKTTFILILQSYRVTRSNESSAFKPSYDEEQRLLYSARGTTPVLGQHLGQGY